MASGCGVGLMDVDTVSATGSNEQLRSQIATSTLLDMSWTKGRPYAAVAVSGLQPASLHRFRVTAVNVVGPSIVVSTYTQANTHISACKTIHDECLSLARRKLRLFTVFVAAQHCTHSAPSSHGCVRWVCVCGGILLQSAANEELVPVLPDRPDPPRFTFVQVL